MQDYGILGDDFWNLFRYSVPVLGSIADTIFASVYGVVEFHVFLREKLEITDPEVDPRLSGHVLRPLVSDSHLYGVRVCLWSTRLWIFLGDDSRKGFRVQHSLV